MYNITLYTITSSVVLKICLLNYNNIQLDGIISLLYINNSITWHIENNCFTSIRRLFYLIVTVRENLIQHKLSEK